MKPHVLLTAAKLCVVGALICGPMTPGSILGQSHSYNGGSYFENFDSMSTITPANWFVGLGSEASGTTVVPSDGSVTPLATSLAYNFGSATTNTQDRALGTIPVGGDRVMEVRIRNDSGRGINTF